MATALRRREKSHVPMTVAEFDAFVDARAGAERFELIDGVVVMMASASVPHGVVVGNIGEPLQRAMRQRKCRAFQGGVAVQASESGTGAFKPIPDIVVSCSSTELGNHIRDPLVVIEVLSPSTMDDDRGRKLDFYRSLQTVQSIALVYQDQMRVEHYYRTEEGWEFETLTKPGEILDLAAVAFQISLADVYADAI